MSPLHHDVIVVGAGISGLVAAWRLHRAGRDVLLIEASNRVGGCIQSERRDGFLLEKGPFNVMVRSPEFADLLGELADDLPLVTAGGRAGSRRYILNDNRLFLAPSGPLNLLTNPVLSLRGRLRLLRGLLFSRRAGAAASSGGMNGRVGTAHHHAGNLGDVHPAESTIDEAACRRLGPEAAGTLVHALVTGIYAGDTRALSLPACFPTVGEIDRRAISPIGHMLRRALTGRKRHDAKSSPRPRGLVSFQEGLGQLPRVLAGRLGARVRTGCRVRSISPVDGGFTLTLEADGAIASTIACGRLILATPVQATAALLRPVAPRAADELDTITCESLAVVNLGFRAADVGHALDGYGFLVARSQKDFPLLGSLWADSIFPHHAPPDHRLIRVFMGGPHHRNVTDRSDDALIQSSIDALRNLLQLCGDPVLTDISRYANGIPQYHAGHRGKIQRAHHAVARIGNLQLIGNYVSGVSINDCVRQAAEFGIAACLKLD